MSRMIIDEEKAYLDQVTFDVFCKYFELNSKYHSEKYCYGDFKFDQKKIENLSQKELLEVSPYILVYGGRLFDEGGRSSTKGFQADRMIKIMKSKGITGEMFLDRYEMFDFPRLGNESAQFISTIFTALEPEDRYDNASSLHGSWEQICNRRNKETIKSFAKVNQGKKQPFELEGIIKLKYKPEAIDFSDDGRLYVLDSTGALHEFINGEKNDEWQLMYGINDNFKNGLMEKIISPTFPNFRVHDKKVFFAYGPKFQKFDLVKIKSEQERLEKELQDMPDFMRDYHKRDNISNRSNNLLKWKPDDERIKEKDIWYHDVCISEDNVFVSASLRTHIHYILQIFEDGSHEKVYEGPYPRDQWRSNNMTDLTLRINHFNRGVYFSESNGISLLTPQGPKAMIKKYEIEHSEDDCETISKFAFGKNFMVAVGRSQEFQEIPVLQTFKPIYENGKNELMKQGDIAQPSYFERTFVQGVPRQAGTMLQTMSLKAHQDRFAFTHDSFKRVFVYKMKS